MSTVSLASKALQRIPNVGPAVAQDLILLGYHAPEDLKGQDPLKMYRRLCEATKARHDPCVLDTFMAAVHFADTGESRKWWEFTERRKASHPGI